LSAFGRDFLVEKHFYTTWIARSQGGSKISLRILLWAERLDKGVEIKVCSWELLKLISYSFFVSFISQWIEEFFSPRDVARFWAALGKQILGCCSSTILSLYFSYACKFALHIIARSAQLLETIWLFSFHWFVPHWIVLVLHNVTWYLSIQVWHMTI